MADLSALQNAADEPEAILRHPNAWFARQWLVALLSERENLISEKIIQVCEKISVTKGTCLDPLACLVGPACDGLGETRKFAR